MAVTQTYGRIEPENGDRGSVFWPALAANAALDDAHNHDGSNSERLTAAAVTAMTASVASGSWGSTIGNGQYRQLKTLPAALTYDSIQITFRDSNGETVYTKHIKVTATTYYVYTNDNTLDLTAVYTS